MTIADLNQMEGRRYPAKRWTRNLVGGASPVQAENFAMGFVVLEPNGGQVPWHNQEQEEIYFIVSGRGEACLGDELREVSSGQVLYIPPTVFHQLTNTSDEPMTMIYAYAPGGDVAHWKQELEGTLPVAGVDVPALPKGAHPQCTEAPEG